MSVTIEQIMQWFPDTSASDWHQHANGGGWVQRTASVADSARVFGNAQVSGNARVFGNAQVFGDARVSGNARAFGNAQVFGDARVFGNAQVSGDAWVFGNAWEVSPLFIQGHKHSLSLCAHNKIAVGCKVHTLDEWPEMPEEIGKQHGYSHLDIEVYRLHLAHMAKVARLLWPTK